MLEKPQEVRETQSLAISPRFKGSARLILNGFPTEKSRIEAELSKNRFLDLEPCLSHPPFRLPNSPTALQPHMHFSPIDSLDRIRDSTRYPNIVPLT